MRARPNQRSSSNFFIKNEGGPILTPFPSLGCRGSQFSGKTSCLKQSRLRGGTYEFKNFAVRRDLDRDCPFVRTVGIGSFLSVCCGRSFWLVGTLRGKERILGKLCSFCGVHALRDGPFPQFTNRIACMGFYHRGDALGVLLIVGFKIRVTSVLSGFLLLLFAIGMVTGLGIKTPFDYSVFSAAGAAFLLAFWEPDRFTLDNLLRRSRS